MAGIVCAADDSRFLNGLTPFRNDKNLRKVWDLSFPHSAALRPLSFRPKGGICFWPAPFRCRRQQIPQRLNTVSE